MTYNVTLILHVGATLGDILYHSNLSVNKTKHFNLETFSTHRFVLLKKDLQIETFGLNDVVCRRHCTKAEENISYYNTRRGLQIQAYSSPSISLSSPPGSARGSSLSSNTAHTLTEGHW